MAEKQILSLQAEAIEPPSLREITLRVQAVGGINLGQGVCQLPIPEILVDAVNDAVKNGVNRYTNPRGLESLRRAIAGKLKRDNKIEVDPEKEVLVTCGSTGAFEGVCATLINPGDRVVSFAPFYPYHHNTLKRFQAEITYVDLKTPHWEFSFTELEQAFSKEVKFVLINTPANPTGKVFSREELEFIGKLCHRFDTLAVTDEIYEYMVFDGKTHISPGSLDSLRDRTITIGGYSKTFAITGWRIGFLALPQRIAEKMVALLDSIYICAPAPLQEAVATAITKLSPDFYQDLSRAYLKKRDYFAAALAEVGFHPYLPVGAYYMMADYRERFPDLSSDNFVRLMIERARVGAVPARDFVVDSSQAGWVRFCFAVPDEVLEKTREQLQLL